jgi:hypothetical protein
MGEQDYIPSKEIAEYMKQQEEVLPFPKQMRDYRKAKHDIEDSEICREAKDRKKVKRGRKRRSNKGGTGPEKTLWAGADRKQLAAWCNYIIEQANVDNEEMILGESVEEELHWPSLFVWRKHRAPERDHLPLVKGKAQNIINPVAGLYPEEWQLLAAEVMAEMKAEEETLDKEYRSKYEAALDAADFKEGMRLGKEWSSKVDKVRRRCYRKLIPQDILNEYNETCREYRKRRAHKKIEHICPDWKCPECGRREPETSRWVVITYTMLTKQMLPVEDRKKYTGRAMCIKCYRGGRWYKERQIKKLRPRETLIQYRHNTWNLQGQHSVSELAANNGLKSITMYQRLQRNKFLWLQWPESGVQRKLYIFDSVDFIDAVDKPLIDVAKQMGKHYRTLLRQLKEPTIRLTEGEVATLKDCLYVLGDG